VRVAGVLTGATAAAVPAEVRAAVGRGCTELLLDLQSMTGPDAAGIATPPDARRRLEAQAGGTPVLRTNGVGCRALEEPGTVTAFALWNGRGM
jgi:hypothetical protein